MNACLSGRGSRTTPAKFSINVFSRVFLSITIRRYSDLSSSGNLSAVSRVSRMLFTAPTEFFTSWAIMRMTFPYDCFSTFRISSPASSRITNFW
ncbi:hypothetical protein D9M69_601050 [compost metagenome]